MIAMEFFSLTNPMLWIIGGGVIVLVLFIMIFFKMVIGKRY